MERELNCGNEITKTGRLPWRTTKKLGQSKNINEYSKRSYEEAVQQENKKPTRTEDWRQHVARSQEYLFKVTFKETRPKEIWTL